MFSIKNILFVVHRYPPYPGGSENYVRDIAENTLSRGINVTVFAGEHKGNLNGVSLTSDPNILLKHWDLIVVHGGNVPIQDLVLYNSHIIKSPILFLLILPSESEAFMRGISNATYIGCSTFDDYAFVNKFNVQHKAIYVPHGINIVNSTGTAGFKEKYKIKTKFMISSCGGYWPNKNHVDLANIFNELKLPDTTLVVTGYDNRCNLMPEATEYVKSFILTERKDMLSALFESDMYIMHSTVEGFGLVLLEAMLNKTSWASRYIAGAKVLSNYGFTYIDNKQLVTHILEMKDKNFIEQNIENNYNYVINKHTIRNTVDGILSVFNS
jgi:glycosyltransferase involved in cell wall biosynthesis